ncbi:hypothetical protein GTP44_01030 [Duganella sp. FT50W]|uniref:Protease (I) and scaffold (Z) protein n=1 Tax=Duganella lactea TaxID=2692173 RepID=A0A6L8MD50_9BURK|nr:phage protease [Duganella lactea]MYM80543.1 hypothetical protein [Duganella lactea]
MKKRTDSPTKARTHATAIAACTMAVTASGEIQLTPVGEFRAADGRPKEVPAWRIDAAIAARVIALAAQRTNPCVIDYEHQTLLTKTNGQPAPAAGWFKTLEWRDDAGLFGVNVDWTPRAKEMIAAGEYKYISPVFQYDETTGEVLQVLMAAITNNPAIDGMDALIAAASLLITTPSDPQPEKESSMDELIQQVIWLLNLPVGSTAEDCATQLQKLIDALKQDTTVTAAASFDMVAYLGKQHSAIAVLSAATPDPAKFVPIETMQALQGRIAALTAETNTTRIDALVTQALDDGKLLPMQEAWARDFGAKDIAALTAYLDSAPQLAILTGTQTKGVPPVNTKTVALTANQQALCKAFGVSPEDFVKTQQEEQAA